MNQEERSRGFLPAMAGSSCTTTSSNRHDETFITYPAADDIITEAEARVLGVAALQRPHLLIVSQAHNGKQSIINWIARRHRPFRVASLLAPVVSMACAELPVRVTEATLCRAVATALGVVACARLEDLISRCREASTRIIVIRDLHDLAMPDWPLHLRLLERLDELTSDAGISLVFTATLRVNELIKQAPRWLERIYVRQLPLWDTPGLVAFLNALATAWRVPSSLEIASLAPVLVETTGGRLGLIMRRLRETIPVTISGERKELEARLWEYEFPTCPRCR